MFFRGRQPEASVWRRFRSIVDGFTFVKRGDHYAAHAVANAERVVDLLHALAEELPPAVDVAIEDVRSGRKWRGESLALPDVREAIGRLKTALVANGGVELAVYTDDDQLTLDPQLELYLYGRTDRWLYVLQGKGLQEVRGVRAKSWKRRAEEFPPAPEMDAALASAVKFLGLEPA
jgi:hypothetical protein